MKTPVLLPFFLLCSVLSFAQYHFEPGYFIQASGEKINCLILNKDWKNNPENFEYRLTKNGETLNAGLNDIQEIVIAKILKYVRAEVEIDQSLTNIGNLSATRNPEWKKDTLFLKTLVEGQATLYYYMKDNLTAFFYETADQPLKQLIHKKYLTDLDRIAENNGYKYQLISDVKCAGQNVNTEKMKFTRAYLADYFADYNQCAAAEFTNFDAKKTRTQFRLKITSGISLMRMEAGNTLEPQYNMDFGTKISFRPGVEAELVLPFNRNKWSLFIEPHFNYYSDKGVNSVGRGRVNYKSVEFPLGLRYYTFLNDRSALFFNVLYDTSLGPIFDTSVSLEARAYFEPPSNQHNVALGAGLKSGKFSAELRHHIVRDVLHQHLYWHADQLRYSLILAYRLI